MLESPYKDKNGRTICHGDVIRFYFSAIEGADLTEMIDIVDFDDGEWMACSDIGRAAFLWRFNDRCEVINNISNMTNEELKKTGWAACNEETS